jgi:hypothetical protein
MHWPFSTRRRNISANLVGVSSRPARSVIRKRAWITYSTSRRKSPARCCRSSSTYIPRTLLPPCIAEVAFRVEITAPTSLRRTEIHRMGRSTSMRVTSQRIAGFQRMASSTPRAAEGVITS